MDISYIALTNTGTTGVSTYNTSTGALNIPNYADLSHLTISNTGTSGAATLISGNLNVPIYASGTLNQVVLTTPSNYSTSSTTAASTGLGVSFTALYNANAFVILNAIVSNSLTTSTASVWVVRAAGAIPAAGAAVGGSDVVISASRLWAAPSAGGQYTNVSAGYDTGITPGTPYNYYLAITVSSGSTTLYSGSALQITEVK